MLSVFPQVTASHVRPSGSYVAGRWVPNAPVSESITVVTPQRADGSLLMQLPEGERAYTHLKTWTRKPLLTGDLLTIGEVEYLVVVAEDWSYDGSFYRALIRRVQS